jgi:hypothetical protein
VMPYHIAPSNALNDIEHTTATLDEAFYQAARMSKKDPSKVFVVWHLDNERGDKRDKRCRAFGHQGVARWAINCTAKPDKWGSHFECETCGGFGLLEDHR